MASIIEDLISILEEEQTIYTELIPIAERKTRVIVDNDLTALQAITEQEQIIIEKINVLENKRQKVVVNIGTVLSRDPDTLDMKTLVDILQKQPVEQKKLSELHDNLKVTIQRLMEINSQNKSLIQQSLEMIEFNMNFIQSTRMSPGNNYTRNASTMDVPPPQTGMFDAKQ